MTLKPVEDYKPKELEEEILKFWKDEHIIENTIYSKPGKKQFNFLEGPPTANAPPALHHVEARVFKDLVNRYNFMKGFSVPRKAGWDCHGLPVEVQIEKKLKLNSKRDIIKYGIDKFVEECRSDVFRFITNWDLLTERMAYWVDMESPYVTMDNSYIESVWWSLKELWKKNLLYEGYRVVPYCTRCGTPLSSHEVAQGYNTISENTVFVRFKIKNKDEYFLAWTTTPWTLLSNVALAVGSDIQYALIQYKDNKYILAEILADKIFPEYELLKVYKGKDLEGIEYEPLFGHFKGKIKNAWRVILGDFVSTEEGTGIVHIAPAFGEDDYVVGQENNLPLVNPIDEDGKFTDQIPELKGIFAKDADPKIIEMLRESDLLIKEKKYDHEYPFCWRCKTPLLYYAMESWFIKVTDIKEQMINLNKKISWYPDNMKGGRFGDWLENVRDWALSRNRFWGTPLPIWKCECGNIEVIGSRDELMKKSIEKIDKNLDLHRPYVDSVKIKCTCGKEMKRVPYVIDCWYDSGAATFAQFHYPFENQDLFKNSFPYDFISEGTDQTRGWFYTLLVLSTILFDEIAYKNVVVCGLLLDDKGEKMSASRGNIIDPWKLFNSIGADAVRLQMCSAAPWNARRFGEESLNEVVIPMLRTLWNCYGFTVKYMILDNFDPREQELKLENLEIEDRWILSVTDNVVKKVEDNLNLNEYHQAVKDINDFIVGDFSRQYIKLIRDRLWLEDKEKIHPSKKAAYVTLSHVLKKLSIVLAPIAPFITEHIYQNLLRRKDSERSIHLVHWPSPENIDENLELQMNIAKKIFESGSYLRQSAGIKLRYPISKVSVVGDDIVKETVKNLSDIIKKQLNSKEVEFVDELKGVEYILTPDFRIIGPKFGNNVSEVANLIKNNGNKIKKELDKKDRIMINNYEITKDMISDIKIKVPEGYSGAKFSFNEYSGIVYIDTKRDQTLINESLTRDLIRNVQELRKKHKLEELERIKVIVSKTKSIETMLKEFKGLVLNEVRADDIMLQEGLKGEISFQFDNEEISVSIITK